MPTAAKRPCAHPGCSELVKSGRCDKHRLEYQAQSRRIEKHENEKTGKAEEARAIHRLYDRRWRHRRIAQLAQEPWCADCLRAGIHRAATDVHHVIRHGGDPEIFHNSPLESLCHECHSRHTLGEIKDVREDYYPSITHPITRPIFIVCGPPASGKTTYVNSHRKLFDIVLDLDEIIAELTGHGLYYPESQTTVRDGIRVRNRKIESLYEYNFEGQSIWVILGAGDPRDRAKWYDLLKPKGVYITYCSKDECIQRIDADIRRMLVRDDQKRAVLRWFDRYKPLPFDQVISTSKPGAFDE